ncbi:MAG: FtsW/RodA/SpoVE family cell cycle protein [Lentisphaerae bacterium]|nr:FtsW/RodA/SpoVE family cell cycle protein [Lentisphaerota bacterium]
MSAQKRRGRNRGVSEPGGHLALLLTGIVSAAYLGVLAAKWSASPLTAVGDALPLAYFLAGALGLGVAFLLFGFRPDRRLLFAALALCGIGVAVQFRFHMHATAPPEGVSRYAGLLGMAACALAALLFRGDFGRRLLLATAPFCYLAALAVLAAMMLLGRRFRGGVFLEGGINPTELTKLFLVIAMAPFIANRRKEFSQTIAGIPFPPLHVAIPFAVLWLLPMLGLVYLRDFGMLVLCSGVLVVMLYAATSRLGYLVAGLVLAGGVTVAGYHLTPHIATRVTAWWTPFRDPTGSSWQTLQGLSAMYTGGAWGIGLGAGSPAQIPVASTDFIYAVIGEELGFLGCLLVVAIFLFLFRAAFDTVDRQPEGAGRLLAAGLAALLALQTLLNLGGVTKAIPITGVPLPFVSHGGSSLVTSFLALGLLLALGAAPAARPKSAKPRTRQKAER